MPELAKHGQFSGFGYNLSHTCYLPLISVCAWMSGGGAESTFSDESCVVCYLDIGDFEQLPIGETLTV